MEQWSRICLLLCLVGFLKEFRPNESFGVEYLVGPWQNQTNDEVSTSFLLQGKDKCVLSAPLLIGYAAGFPRMDVFLCRPSRRCLSCHGLFALQANCSVRRTKFYHILHHSYMVLRNSSYAGKGPVMGYVKLHHQLPIATELYVDILYC